ncbi:MAG: PfkB family carbohydrate kinase [Longicatena sp.]
MRNTNEMFSLIVTTANNNPNILAVFLNGSRANPTIREDILQDYDIVFVVEDTSLFINNPSWIDCFGKLSMIQRVDELDKNCGKQTHFEDEYTYLMLFEDGNRIDLKLMSNAYAKQIYPYSSQTKILLDKQNIFTAVPFNKQDYSIRKPNQATFTYCCNDFWWCLQNVAKGIWRDELPYAKTMFDTIVRKNLHQMINWYLGILYHFEISSGKFEKYYKQYLPKEDYDLFIQTYSDANYQNFQCAIENTCDLFHRLALKVSQALTLTYNQEEETNMRIYCSKVTTLSKNADSIFEENTHNERVLFIGSSVVDVIIHVPYLPSLTQDVNIKEQSLALGGCAFNAHWMCHLLGVPSLLFSPVGSGIYGEYVAEQFIQKGLGTPFLLTNEENGCCYCFVDDNGERTFLSNQRAEYKFKKEWFAKLDAYQFHSVYVCGLELEETTGIYIIEYLEAHNELDIYFAPGPRILSIEASSMKRMLSLSPILHLNKEEAFAISQKTSIEEAALFLYKQTNNTVIITLGANGAYVFDNKKGCIIPSVHANQIDCIGAGDAHIGSIIAYRALGYELHDAVRKANHISAQVVETQGATLSREAFKKATRKI